MIRGRSCWNAMQQRGMSERVVGGASAYTFDSLPETLFDGLAATAGRVPEACALVDDDARRYTFAELHRLAGSIASYLQGAHGVGEGDRVGILLEASVEFCTAYFACSMIGAVAVPLSTKFREPEIASLVERASLNVLLIDERFGAWAECLSSACPAVLVCNRTAQGFGYPEALRAWPKPRRAGSLASDAVMMYTSGTTSASKGVLLTNANVLHAATVYRRLMGTTEEDRTVIPVPIYHITGLVALLTQFVLVGATTYIHRRFDARRLLDCVRDEKITYLHASPTAFEKVLELRDEYPELPSLRALLSGSSYEPVSKMRAFHEWLPTCAFQVVYGMTETASPALLFPYDSPTSIYAGATGKPVPGVDVRIVDDEGRDVEVGAVGELLLSGACVTRGYHEHACEVLDRTGWLPTGDMGYANAEGMVWVVDRKKDMINRGGEKIWCSSLEETLCGIDGVREACVAGIPDELYGEVAVAAVVPLPGAELTEGGLRDTLRGLVAGFEIPERIVFVDHIPQTVGDKPDRAAVRAAVLEIRRS